MKNSPDKKEEHDVPLDDLLQDIERLKGNGTPKKTAPIDPSILYPATAAVAAEERRKKEALRKAEEEVVKSAVPGQEIPGKGIFIGTWQPPGLRQKFNVYAAKEDLTNEAGEKELYTYLGAIKRVSELKDWHGFDGTNYTIDQELYGALRSGSYKGGWFIPPRELLTGTAADGPHGIRPGAPAQRDNLYDYKDKGVLRRSFSADAYDSNGRNWYWSSTAYSQYIWHAQFGDRSEGCSASTTDSQLSCRPVRLEPVP